MSGPLTFAFTIIWLFSALAPLQGASERPKNGGTLAMAIRKDVTNMNALVGTSSTEQSIRELMFDTLLGIDMKGQVQPSLAASWDISSDGKTYTFHLRKGVKFHNGQEVTAEDAKFALDYTMNPKNGATGYGNLDLVDRAEARDKHTLRITLKRPSASFLYTVATIRNFSVIPQGSLQDGVTKLPKYPPGTGPFRFVDWKPGQQVVFERNPNYWGQKSFLDRLILRPIANDTVRITAVRAGDIDMAEAVPYEWVKQILEGKLKGINVFESAEAGFRVLKFNVPSPPFNNKLLRQAVAHAIDKKEILQAAFYGFGQPTDQRYRKGNLWHVEGIRSPVYDPNRAKALLKEAGYKGETIEMVVRQGADQETEATTIQAQLARIGMNIKLSVVEPGIYTSRRFSGDYTFIPSGGSNEPDPSPTYGPEYKCPADIKKRTRNDTGYCDKEMDALIAALETELNVERRRELVRQIVQKGAEDLSELSIGFVPRFFAHRDYVKGFTSDGEGRFRWGGGGLNYTWLDK